MTYPTKDVILGSPDASLEQFYCSGWRTANSQLFKLSGNLPITQMSLVNHKVTVAKAKEQMFKVKENTGKKHCHLSINLQWCLGTKGPLQLSGPLNGQLSTCGHLREEKKISSTLQPCTWAFQQHYCLIVGMGPSGSPCWNRHLLGFKWITLYNEHDYCLIAKSIPC